MKIKNHRLFLNDGTAAEYKRSPNQSGKITPEYLVIHYTAGSSAASSINWLTNPDAGASAHLVIGRDGSITQLVAFNRKAWHAGHSRWAGREGLNSFSIGVELDNPGQLMRYGDGWSSTWQHPIASENVVEATHKNGGEVCGWHTYTTVQLEVLRDVATCLARKYRLKDILGHEDIAPQRKTDPGPAFPMAAIRSLIIGRHQEVPAVYSTTAVLNIRSGPGVDHAKLSFGPLPRETRVEVIDEAGVWRHVDVQDAIENDTHRTGWVHGHYLALA